MALVPTAIFVRRVVCAFLLCTGVVLICAAPNRRQERLIKTVELKHLTAEARDEIQTRWAALGQRGSELTRATEWQAEADFDQSAVGFAGRSAAASAVEDSREAFRAANKEFESLVEIASHAARAAPVEQRGGSHRDDQAEATPSRRRRETLVTGRVMVARNSRAMERAVSKPSVWMHGGIIVVLLFTVLATASWLPSFLIPYISLALLLVAYGLSYFEDAQPVPGTRIPHGHWSISASSVASAGFGLLGLYAMRTEAGDEAKVEEAPRGTLSFEAWFYCEVFKTHAALISILLASMIILIGRCKCIGETAGYPILVGTVAGLIARCGIHALPDREMANRVAPLVSTASFAATSVASCMQLTSNLNSGHGEVLCPGSQNAYEVADAWIALIFEFPFNALFHGAFHMLNGGGSTDQIKVYQSVTYLIVLTVIMIIFAAEHGAQMGLSISYLWATSVAAYGVGAYLGHQVLCDRLAAFQQQRVSNNDGTKQAKKFRVRQGQRSSLQNNSKEMKQADVDLEQNNVRPAIGSGSSEGEPEKVVHSRQVVHVKEDNDPEERYCAICTENISNVLLLPCRHLKCCATCVLMMSRRPPILCPMCRTRVEDHVVVIT